MTQNDLEIFSRCPFACYASRATRHVYDLSTAAARLNVMIVCARGHTYVRLLNEPVRSKHRMQDLGIGLRAQATRRAPVKACVCVAMTIPDVTE